MQMSLSGFLTFIYPYAEYYSRVKNYKLRRKVLRLLKRKKIKTQELSTCPKSVLLTAIMAIWNTLFLLIYSSESPTAPCQGRHLALCCALSPELCQTLPVPTCRTGCGSVLNATAFLHCHRPQSCAAWAGDFWGAGHGSSVQHLLLHHIHFTAAYLLPLWMASSPNSKTCRDAEA